MRKALLVFSYIVFALCLFSVCTVLAEDEGWKQELTADKQEIKAERAETKEHAQEARAEEKGLRDQIHAAMQSGDKETAQKLRSQLRSMHQENVGQMRQDKKDIKINMQDFKQDVKEVRQEGNLPPRRDRDNNPPGPMGGPGTNWENRPGLQGGPGTSPDRRPVMDRDNNPPGPMGGRGTNWENKPGPQGGVGTSPNIRGPKMQQGAAQAGQQSGPKGGVGGSPRGGRGGQRR